MLLTCTHRSTSSEHYFLHKPWDTFCFQVNTAVQQCVWTIFSEEAGSALGLSIFIYSVSYIGRKEPKWIRQPAMPHKFINSRSIEISNVNRSFPLANTVSMFIRRSALVYAIIPLVILSWRGWDTAWMVTLSIAIPKGLKYIVTKFSELGKKWWVFNARRINMFIIWLMFIEY